MSKYTNPGVYSKETDLSQIVGVSGNSVGAVVGGSSRGPINKATLITNTKDFISTFGEPDISLGYMPHTALAFLEESNSLYVTRVVGAASTHAALKINKYVEVVISDEVLGQGDGTSTNFSLFTDNLEGGIIPESLSILVEDQAGTAGVDVSGLIYGDGITSGTIDYDTGKLELVLDVAAGAGKEITLSYTYVDTQTTAYGGLPITSLENDQFNTDTLSVLAIRAENPGTWANSVKISLDNIDSKDKTFTIKVYETIDGVDILKESFEDCSRKEGIDGYGISQYIEDRINGKSKYIVVYNNPGVDEDILSHTFSLVPLAGGSDETLLDSEVVTGWGVYDNPDEVEVNILLNAGYVTDTTFSVQSKMKSLAESRRDCIAILDAPYNKSLDANALIAWRNTTQRFNSSFIALFAPWVYVNNSFNGKSQIVPPSGFIGQLLVRTDADRDPWVAPAGLTRGLIKSGILPVTKLAVAFDAGEQGLLYNAGINYIVSKPGRGIVLWGQKTQQYKKSALDRINVRRLLITIEKSVKQALEFAVFETNDEFTRSQLEESVANFMDQIQARAGVSAYEVICDESNNTDLVIDQNQLNLDIYVQPAKSAEFIQLQTVVTRTGVSFTN